MKQTLLTQLADGTLILVAGLGLANAADCQKKYYSPDWVAQPPKVDVYNYDRAETDLQFKGYSEKYKAFGKFAHSRKPYDVHKQVTQSGNRDTLYSFGVFDLSKSPLTIELLEIGTRYIMFGIRTFADPNSKEDLARAHKLQDAMRVSQSDPGDLSGIPDWNEKKMMELRKDFNNLGSTLPDSSTFFGVKCDRSYLQNALGVAVGWGGLQRRDALYLPVQVAKNDGKTAYTLTVPRDVPIEDNGFWSVTVYNKDRFMEPNDLDAYSFNKVTARKNEDGSATIHFGGNPKADNYLPIMEGWVYIVRLYRPKKALLDGKWKFPEPAEAK
ncbi:DUF1214 domain-containing protein [Thiolapillus sp.]|uniref:DUF1214 domain-containing protein n=6 Tax=Thiolapillus sp. TaxID=2017437 RepID=UPI003AF5CF95